MGWTYVRTSRDQLIRELTAPQDGERVRTEVIDHTLVGNVLWTVVRVTAKQADVAGVKVDESVCFIHCDLLESAGCEWGYKALTEAEHPYYYSCPMHYLDMAPAQCADWRKRVRAHHAQRPADGRADDLARG